MLTVIDTRTKSRRREKFHLCVWEKSTFDPCLCVPTWTWIKFFDEPWIIPCGDVETNWEMLFLSLLLFSFFASVVNGHFIWLNWNDWRLAEKREQKWKSEKDWRSIRNSQRDFYSQTIKCFQINSTAWKMQKLSKLFIGENWNILLVMLSKWCNNFVCNQFKVHDKAKYLCVHVIAVLV